MSASLSSDCSMDEMTPHDTGLSPYAQCPSGTPGECRFSAFPEVTEPDVPGPYNDCSVFRCGRCGHGVSRPAMPNVGVLYEGRESQDYQGKDGAVATFIKKTAFLRQTKKLMAQTRFCGGVIADFGCGSGLYTNAIAAAAPAGSQVHALDFFEDPPELLENVTYVPFEQKERLAGSADLVTCFHAVEHDDNPQAFLARLLEMLKPGGTLVIEVPNANCGWRKVFGRFWDNWYLPYHRLHFTRGSLRALLEQAGMTVQSEHANHVPVMGRSVARLLGQPNSLIFVGLSAALQPLQWIGEVLTGEPSALRIIARKPD